MRVLSVRQPWASLLVRGVKDIENRTWSTTYRGPVLIHACAGAPRVGFGLPADEIADIAGISPANIYTKLTRIRQLLAAQVGAGEST